MSEPLDPAGAERGGALAGIVVVELARTVAGEIAGGVLADLGATVVKVEPGDGAPTRRLGPALPGEDALYFQSENRGKRAVQAELAELASGGSLGRLLDGVDALVEDLGPGQLEAAGLAPDVLLARNPALAVLRISPFGQDGPLAGERGDDRIAQAFSGAQFATGYPDRPPIPATVPIAAAWTGVHGASGLLMAIYHARRSGRGQVVDLGLYQTALRMQEDVVVRYERDGAITSRLGTESPTIVPANVYRSRDGGWIALSGAGDQPFARLCEVIGAPDAPKDPRFATGAARLEHRDAANAVVAAWVAEHDMADVEKRFAAAGVTGTAVRSVDEIIADEHVEVRGALLRLRSHTGRAFLAPGPVPQLSRTPARPAERAPRLGEDTAAVRAGVEALRRRPPVHAPAPARGGGPLAGVRVLDLSQWLAGPAAAAILGDFGADVIMVELPGATAQARGPGFVVTNRNKRSVTLDVRAPIGREVFLDLARHSDVIVENFRPGTLERWDLAPATLLAVNPRLVIVRSSGFGQTGPNAARAAFNPVGLAFGGMTYLNGWPDRAPLRDGVTAGDYSTALFNVLGVLAALLRRDVDFQGQVVDTAMYEAALRMTGDALAVRSALGMRRERAAGAWPLFPASATAEAADGRHVAVSAASEDDLAAALERLGRRRPADAGAARDELTKLVGGLAADQAVAELRGAGVAASAVNSVADLVRDPHLWSRGDLLRLSHPELGEIVTQGVVPRLSLTPGRVAGWSRHPGSDTEAVLAEVLGYSPEEIRKVADAAPGRP